MGCGPRELVGRLPLIVAFLAMTGMEWDALCGPFSSVQMLRWVEASAAEDGERAGPARDGSQLAPTPELHDLFALGSRGRASAIPSLSPSAPPSRLPTVSSPGGRPAHALSPACRPSPIDRLSRMLC